MPVLAQEVYLTKKVYVPALKDTAFKKVVGCGKLIKEPPSPQEAYAEEIFVPF
jgi:hypothetical protein